MMFAGLLKQHSLFLCKTVEQDEIAEKTRKRMLAGTCNGKHEMDPEHKGPME